MLYATLNKWVSRARLNLPIVKELFLTGAGRKFLTAGADERKLWGPIRRVFVRGWTMLL